MTFSKVSNFFIDFDYTREKILIETDFARNTQMLKFGAFPN